MKKKIILNLGIAILFASIFWMRMHGHRGLVHPEKPVWKVITAGTISNRDTVLENFSLHHSLVHPKTLVWKEFALVDSALYNQKKVR
jgi:hypothetical protein